MTEKKMKMRNIITLALIHNRNVFLNTHYRKTEMRTTLEGSEAYAIFNQLIHTHTNIIYYEYTPTHRTHTQHTVRCVSHIRKLAVRKQYKMISISNGINCLFSFCIILFIPSHSRTCDTHRVAGHH